MFMMKFIQSFKMSISSILSNRGRSALTMLGIIIGCASVIILTGIGGGATKQITDSISEMGVNRITVSMTRGRESSRFIDIDDMEEYLLDNPAFRQINFSLHALQKDSPEDGKILDNILSFCICYFFKNTVL